MESSNSTALTVLVDFTHAVDPVRFRRLALLLFGGGPIVDSST